MIFHSYTKVYGGGRGEASMTLPLGMETGAFLEAGLTTCANGLGMCIF